MRIRLVFLDYQEQTVSFPAIANAMCVEQVSFTFVERASCVFSEETKMQVMQLYYCCVERNRAELLLKVLLYLNQFAADLHPNDNLRQIILFSFTLCAKIDYNQTLC